MENLTDLAERLSDIERQKIIKVLEKDLDLQRSEQERIRRIHSQLNIIRQKSALRTSTRRRSSLSTRQKCARCKGKLGYSLNSSNACRKCKQLVCVKCRNTVKNGGSEKQQETTTNWLCVLCYTTREYCAASGEWFYRRKYQPSPSSIRSDPGVFVSGAMSDDEPVSDNISISLALLGELQKAVRRSWQPIDTVVVPSQDLSTNSTAPVKFRDNNPFKRGETKRRSSRRYSKGRQRPVSSTPGALSVDTDNLPQERKSSHAPNMSLLSVPNQNEKAVQRSPSMPGQIQTQHRSNQDRSPQRNSMLTPISTVKAVSTGNLFENTSGSKTSVKKSTGLPDDLRSSKETVNSADRESFTSSWQSTASAPSITSICTDSGIEIQGEINLELNYNCRQGALEVNVIQARGLAPVDRKKNQSNPYVKVYLVPDKSLNSKRKTKVKRHTLDPVFQEILKYTGMTKSEFEGKTLFISVWHNDRLGTNTFLGEVGLPLSDYPWTSQTGLSYWYTLGKKHEEPPPDPSHPSNYCGEMSLSIKYMPPDVTRGETSAGSLHCLIRSVKHLVSSRPGAVMNVVLKAYLYPDKRRTSKQKSESVRGLTDMIFNHTFVYLDQTIAELIEHCLELTVWDHQRLATNEFLGGIRLNLGSGLCKEKQVDWMDGSPEEISIWKKVLERPNSWVESTIPLRTTMAPR